MSETIEATAPAAAGESLLRVRGLAVRYRAGRGSPVTAAEGVGFDVAPGETVGLLGESGCGKSSVALAIPALLPPNGRAEGSVRLLGRELAGLDERSLERVRGGEVGLVFQEPALALNPVLRAGRQVAEVVRAHRRLPWRRCEEEAARLLAEMRFPDPGRIFDARPHQLSGGERQRVAIAQALAGRPPLVIADEPTASLDAATEAEVLALLRELRRERRLALLLISHDPRVLAAMADRLLVMHGGRIVEEGPAAEVLRAPRHPHTAELLQALPRAAASGCEEDAPGEPRVRARGLRKAYEGRSGGPPAAALDGVDLDLPAGRRVALVGPSGSGKSTLARCLALLEEPEAGEIRLGGLDLLALPPRERRRFRPRLQLVFQDPAAALEPRFTALAAVEEPLRLAGGGDRRERRARALDLLARVGLPPEIAGRRTRSLSGGQKQRVALARALATRPDLLVLDEPFTGLDLRRQAAVARLLVAAQEAEGFACLLVTHDLRLAAALAGEVAVLDRGRIVDRGAPGELARRPGHETTRALLAAFGSAALPGEPPS